MTLSRVLDTAYAAALSAWAGVIAMVGVVAAGAFPIVKELDPTVPSLAAYKGEHWRIVAGRVLNYAFNAADTLGAFAFGVAFLALVLAMLLGRAPAGKLRHARHGVFIAIAAVSAYTIFLFRPEMQEHLLAHWAAAESGNTAQAEEHRAAFAAMHGGASALLMITLLLTLIGAATSALAPFREPASDAETTGDAGDAGGKSA